MARISQTYTFSSQSYFHDREGAGLAQASTKRINPHSKPVVSYYFPENVGEHHYGERHPMKPHRLTLTNALVLGYGLEKKINNFYNPRPATEEELEEYHDRDYIKFLSKVTPENQHRPDIKGDIDEYNCVEDCPIFADMYDFCRLYTGGSIAGARKLAAGTTDVAINWSGGLHHAKRGEASGFCYINDIVLAIQQLLRVHPRVLYIDIDIHHGDGVELAFWQSNRVMTVSFHKYTGDFFPGTGKLEDCGGGLGKHFAVNVPLQDGIDDESYLAVFKSVIDDVVTAFRPSSIVLQCGADSLGCDRLGAFNLSIAAHGQCVEFVQKYKVPLLVLGGGGYTIHNVSRCWTYETAVLVGADVPNELPHTVYDNYFAPDYQLHAPIVNKMDNMNTPASLQKITINVRNKMRYLQGAPSVAMQEIPPDLGEWLDSQEKSKDEVDESKGTGQAGETREDGHRASNDYFAGDGDNDKVPTPPPSRGTATPRRARARSGRRPGRPPGRGRGAARGAAAAAAAAAQAAAANKETPEEESSSSSSSESADSTPAPKRGGRGGRRGRRGRARGGVTRATPKVPEPEPEPEEAQQDDKEKASATPAAEGEDVQMADPPPATD